MLSGSRQIIYFSAQSCFFSEKIIRTHFVAQRSAQVRGLHMDEMQLLVVISKSNALLNANLESHCIGNC